MSSDHDRLEKRAMVLAREVVRKIDADPRRIGLEQARQRCRLWLEQRPNPYLIHWQELLLQNWAEVRLMLLADTEEARQLRQNSPFCGVLTPQERWQVYRHAQE
ncbi:MAG: hypothetical protein U0931_32020 [Vulcanimicrobiota bacterium]